MTLYQYSMVKTGMSNKSKMAVIVLKNKDEQIEYGKDDKIAACQTYTNMLPDEKWQN